MLKKVILVSSTGERIGEMEKIKAHELGSLHQAFSIFIYNSKNELLLQQRHINKYHSGGLWTNTCCSHPEPDDKRDIKEIAKERLFCEMGIFCDLEENSTHSYNLQVGKLIENEYNTIFTGYYEDNPILNPIEASSYKWVSIEKVIQDIKLFPDNYTSWFKLMIKNNIGIIN